MATISPGGGGEGGLVISSEGDDRRIFLGLKFSIPGFSWVGKFGKYFFGYLNLRRDFLGYSKQYEFGGLNFGPGTFVF